MSKKRSKYTVELEYNDAPLDTESLPWRGIWERKPSAVLAVVLSPGKIKFKITHGTESTSYTVCGEYCLVMHRDGMVALLGKNAFRRAFEFTEDAGDE